MQYEKNLRQIPNTKTQMQIQTQIYVSNVSGAMRERPDASEGGF